MAQNRKGFEWLCRAKAKYGKVPRRRCVARLWRCGDLIGTAKKPTYIKERRKPKIELDYTILSSGSVGNAVRIRNIMIDCGIAFNKMKEELYKCQYLLITHDHQDHVKPAVLNQIVKQFPNIEIYSTYKVARMNDSVIAINTDYLPIWLEKAKCNMWAVPVPHNTLCFAYILSFDDDLDVVYSTDLMRTDELSRFTEDSGFQYDYTFLEANYDETKLRLLGDSWHGQYNAYVDSSERHLSRDDSLKFYAKYRKEGGEYIELHKSTRFY